MSVAPGKQLASSDSSAPGNRNLHTKSGNGGQCNTPRPESKESSTGPNVPGRVPGLFLERWPPCCTISHFLKRSRSNSYKREGQSREEMERSSRCRYTWSVGLPQVAFQLLAPGAPLVAVASRAGDLSAGGPHSKRQQTSLFPRCRLLVRELYNFTE